MLVSLMSIAKGRASVGEIEQVVQFYWLILGSLAVWRISYLFASESGPWNFAREDSTRAGERGRERVGNLPLLSERLDRNALRLLTWRILEAAAPALAGAFGRCDHRRALGELGDSPAAVLRRPGRTRSGEPACVAAGTQKDFNTTLTA